MENGLRSLLGIDIHYSQMIEEYCNKFLGFNFRGLGGVVALGAIFDRFLPERGQIVGAPIQTL